MEVMFFVSSFIDGKQHKARERDMIALRNHAPRFIHDMITRDLECPWNLLCNLLLDGAGFENSLYAIGLSENS